MSPRNVGERRASSGPTWRDDPNIKPVFLVAGVEPQTDSGLCPVYDVVTHRLTNLSFLKRCTLARGHRGACDLR